MDVKNLVLAVVGMVLAAVMIGGALLPSIAGALENEKTFSNREDALYDMAHIDENTDYTLIWNASAPTIVTVNGETADLRSGTIICSMNNWTIRFGSSDNGYYIQPVSTTFDGSINSGLYPTAEVRLSVSNGEVSYQILNTDFSETIRTETVTNGYGIVADGKGDFVMKAPDQNAYVLDSSTIAGIGVTTVDGAWYVGFSATGTVLDLDIMQYSGGVNYTISDEVITSSVVDGYDSLNTILKYEFDVTNPDSLSETHITYNYFIVPAEVTAYITGSGLTAPISALFNAIPLIAIAGLVMTGVYVFISRK